MYTFTTPFGKIDVQLNGNKIVKISFLSQNTSEKTLPTSVQQELEHYFQNPRHTFHLPIDLKGTPFQQSVWQALREIPSGTTITYKMLADRLQTGPRAVGNACRANPVPLLIPCHRVVAKNGLGGFAGDVSGKLIAIKKWLLQHEAL